MIKRSYIFLIFILIILTISCRKEFNFQKLSDKKQINVSCFIRAGDSVRVRLSYVYQGSIISDIFSKELFITNAQVYLFEDNIFEEKLEYTELNYLHYSEFGWYYSKNFIPQEGHKYELKIVVPDFDTIYSETYIPKSIRIDSIVINSIKEEDYSYMVNCLFFFVDNPLEANYYLINSFNNIKSQDPIIESKIDNWFNSFAPNLNERNAYFSDEFITGKNYGLNIITYYYPDNKNYYYFYTLSRDAYLFYKTSFLYSKTLDNPLSEPVVIYSNIVNGTGIFAGMSADIDSIVLIKNKLK